MTYSRREPQTVEPGPGQESVWDFPRPPRVESETRPVKIIFNEQKIVETDGALRVLETSHPPNIYVPLPDVSREVLRPNNQRTICEWKGAADYWDVIVGSRTAESGAWSYAKPRPGYQEIAGYVSFYPALMDGCYLGDEQVTPQPGRFYGGWITGDVVGPFKGAEGTSGW